ncbi:MAG: radical SAM protein [Candidatus Omnitrophica bacterium]|nr:radical SAM protein [Candidatus Omnitrophota bacterium]
MKILLINPPVFNDIGVCKSETPPLSLLYLGGYLEKYGFKDIKIIDADREGLTWLALGDLLVKENPDVVGIGGPSFVLPALIKTAEIARQKLPYCTIIAGGFGPTKEPEKVLKAVDQAVNFIVMGEGEETLLELVKRIETGDKNFNNIKGLAFLDQGGKLVITEPRGYIMDLDSIPWPAFHLLTTDFSKYPGAPLSPKKYKEMREPRATIVGARGCPHRCTFCSLGSRLYRHRSPKDIVAEMEYYKNKFHVRSIQIYDDEFIGMSPKQNEWVREICDEIIKKNLQKDLTFLVQGRCSQFVELETLKVMKRAGFAWIWWGVESGSQRILDDVIHKDIKIENIHRAFGLAKKAGLKSLMFIMVGFPSETPDDIKLSADLIKKIKPDDIGIHVLTPYPGSELRKYFEDRNLLENLNDYYKYDTNLNVNHHTEEMTASEIMKYYRLLIFRFEHNNWHFIKFGLKSLLTLDGWRKLAKRIRIVFNYFTGWAKIN